MQYKQRYTFKKINQETAPDKRGSDTHWNIVNLGTYLTNRGASLTLESGTLPISSSLLNGLWIIGDCYVGDEVYLFATDNAGTDKIVRLSESSDSVSVVAEKEGDMNFNLNYPIQAVGNKNGEVVKLYWVDGLNQARNATIGNSSLIIENVVDMEVLPTISLIRLGNNAAEDSYKVRYGVVMYNKGGSESPVLGLTYALNVSKDLGSAQVQVSIPEGIEFDAFRIVRVKWSTYNTAPVYDIVFESQASPGTYTLIDGGEAFIASSSAEEFFDFGSTYMIPKTINVKKQRAFYGNYTVDTFQVAADLRAFSHSGTSSVSETPTPIASSDTISMIANSTSDQERWTVEEKSIDDTQYTIGVKNSDAINYIPNLSNFTQTVFDPNNTDPVVIDTGTTHFAYQLRVEAPVARIRVTSVTGFPEVKMRLENDAGTQVYRTFNSDYSSRLIDLEVNDDINLREWSLNRYYNTKEVINLEGQSNYVLKFFSTTAINNEVGDANTFTIEVGTQKGWEYATTVAIADVPEIDGYSYSGITGVLATSQFWFSQQGPYGGNTLITNFTSTEVSGGNMILKKTTSTPLTFIGIGGSLTAYSSFVDMKMYLRTEGSKYEILGAGLQLKNDASSGTVTGYSSFINIPTDSDAVNPDPNVNKFMADATTLGAEGPVTSIRAVTKTLNLDINDERTQELSDPTIHRSGEKYRVGVKCYDKYGRFSPVYWVCDYTIPDITMSSGSVASNNITNHYTLEGKLNLDAPGMESVEGYKFVYVERTNANSTRLAQGVMQPIMDYYVPAGNWYLPAQVKGTHPFPNMKTVNTHTEETKWSVTRGAVPSNETGSNECDWPDIAVAGALSFINFHNSALNIIYTPETQLYPFNMPVDGIKIVGVAKLRSGAGFMKAYFTDPDTPAYNDVEASSTDLDTNYMNTNVRTAIGSQGNVAPVVQFDGFGNPSSTPENPAFVQYMTMRESSIVYPSTNNVGPYTVSDTRYLGINATVAIGSDIVSNLMNYTNFSSSENDTVKTNFGAEMLDGYLVNMENPNWSGVISGTVNVNQYDNFYSNFKSATYNALTDVRGFPIADMTQTLVNQYGGASNEAKSFNVYIDASSFSTSSTEYTPIKGDCFLGVYTLPKTGGSSYYGNNQYTTIYDYITVPLESRVLMREANEVLRETAPNLDTANAKNLRLISVQNLLSYNTVFSQAPNDNVSVPISFTTTLTKEYTNRVVATGAKIVGESIDAWTKVNLGSYLDLDGTFGDITAIVRSENELVAFQPRAVSVLSILPEKQVTSNSGIVSLGKGEVLDNFTYIDTNAGLENPQAVVAVGKEVFFIDTRKRTLNSLKDGEISVLKGFNASVKSLMGVEASNTIAQDAGNGTFVYLNEATKEIHFRYTGIEGVLCYNYIVKEFTKRRTYQAAQYFVSSKNRVVAAVSGQLHLHDMGDIGNYYGTHSDAFIAMLLEPVPLTDKIFDSIEVMKDGAIFDQYRVVSETRISGDDFSALTFSGKFDKHVAYFPRVYDTENSKVTSERFREKYVLLTLKYTGTDPMYVDEIFIKFRIKK